MKSAEEDLFEEQRRRDEWVQKVRNGWEQEKKKAGELAKEIVLLKSQVERGAVEREEERVMREEMSGAGPSGEGGETRAKRGGGKEEGFDDDI